MTFTTTTMLTKSTEYDEFPRVEREADEDAATDWEPDPEEGWDEERSGGFGEGDF